MKHIVIIGAGPAGLTAGYELIKKSDKYRVTILEESDAIGGISRTVNYNGNRMDLGGHRFFSKNKRVNDWWNEIMPLQGKPSYDDKLLNRTVRLADDGPDPDTEDSVLLIRNRVSRIYYKRKFFDYPVKMNMNTIKNMGLGTTLFSGGSYLMSCAHKLDESNLENFYINRFGRKLYSIFFEDYTNKLWGRHPSKISADWGAQRVKGLSIKAIIKDVISKTNPFGSKEEVETSLIEEFLYPKLGPGQLWEKTAEKFEKMGGTIIRNFKVDKLDNSDGVIKGVSGICNGERQSIDGDIFISTMPLKDLIAGMKAVPEEIGAIANGLPYRDFITVGLLVKKLSIKNETKIKTINNLVPDCWIYVQDKGIKMGRIQIFNNWSPYMVQKPLDTVWVGLEYFCDEGDKYWRLSDEKWRIFATRELIKMGVIESEEDVLDSHRESVRKAYPAYFDTYASIDLLIDYLNKYDNLYCIGRNGQHRYNNMDHSMLTAFEAVDNIEREDYRDKSLIWKVNTEKEYHEEKDS